MKLSIAIVLSLFIYSCAQEKAIIEDQSNNEFQKVDSLVLEIDEIGTVDHSTIASYYDDDGGAVAIIRTTIDRRYIDIFHVETGELLNRIPIEYEGPDGVGSEISNMVIYDPNSIYLFNQWTGLLTHHGVDGKIMNRYKINFNEQGGRGYLSPGSLSFQNYIVHNNNIYIPGWLPWANEAKSTEQIGVVNLKTNEVSTFFSRPEQYESYMWGIGYLYYLYMDFNSRTQELILSFPIENDLITYNLENGKTNRIKATTKFFDEVKPFGSDFEIIDRKAFEEHGYNTGSYSGVIFDPSNNYTYRFAVSAEVRKGFQENVYGDLSIIVLDENYTLVNEVPLKRKDLDLRMEFTSNKGWYVLNSKATNEKEGQLVFDIYSYR